MKMPFGYQYTATVMPKVMPDTNSPQSQAEAMAREIVDDAFQSGRHALIASISTALSKLIAENERLKAREVAMVQADPRQLWNLATFELKEQLTATEAKLNSANGWYPKELDQWVKHSGACDKSGKRSDKLRRPVYCTCGLDDFKSRAFLSTLTAEKKEEAK